MVRLSPVLSRRLKVYRQPKRIVDESTGSYYEIVAADAAGNLGHNPSGIVFDEVLTQPDSTLWDAMRTGMGTRLAPLMVAATTAGNDPNSFAKAEHNESLRVLEDPDRARHRFVFLRNTPPDADPWKESSWRHANPALGDFLSIQALREEAVEARNDPARENAFRQYRLNQWVRQASRWMPMHLYEASSGEPWPTPSWGRDKLKGRTAWCGFDLAAKFDLSAWCLVFPPTEQDGPVEVLWRFWLPEAALDHLAKHVGDDRFDRWTRDGWIIATPGEVLDYDQVYADIETDHRTFHIRGGDCDQWSMYPVIAEIGKRLGAEVERDLVPYASTYERMTPGMTELMALVRQQRLHHHNNPVAAYCFDSVEVRRAAYNPELIRPNKPERGATGKRIDAVPAAAMALAAWTARGKSEPRRSAYEDGAGLMVV